MNRVVKSVVVGILLSSTNISAEGVNSICTAIGVKTAGKWYKVDKTSEIGKELTVVRYDVSSNLIIVGNSLFTYDRGYKSITIYRSDKAFLAISNSNRDAITVSTPDAKTMIRYTCISSL